MVANSTILETHDGIEIERIKPFYAQACHIASVNTENSIPAGVSKFFCTDSLRA